MAYNINEIVLYVKNKDTSALGKTKKDVWIVRSIYYSYNNVYTLKSISNSHKATFEAYDKDIMSVAELIKKGFSMKHLINDAAYKTIMGRSMIQNKNDYLEAEADMKDKIFKRNNVKEINMSNKVKQQIDANVSAGKVAASITAGKTLNNILIDKIKPQLPLMLKGYADTPLGTVVVANIADVAVKQFMPYNKKANLATKAMMEAAMVDMLASFDLEKMVNEVINSVELPAE